jgi:hypothetical protein
LEGFEFPIPEGIADMFGEAGSHKQELVPITDRLRERGDGDGQLEFHKLIKQKFL